MSGSTADLTAAPKSVSPEDELMREADEDAMRKAKEEAMRKEKEELFETSYITWNDSMYYKNRRCECCRSLAVRVFEPMSDDEDYACPGDDNGVGDEGLKIRKINYRRSIYNSGGFTVECPPDGCMDGIFNKAHFWADYLDDAINESIRHAIDTYNAKRDCGKKLVHKHTLNVTISRANYYVFYVTFEGFELDDADVTGKAGVYETIVSYSGLDRFVDDILVLRRQGGEDLLEPDSYYGPVSRPTSYYDQLAQQAQQAK